MTDLQEARSKHMWRACALIETENCIGLDVILTADTIH